MFTWGWYNTVTLHQSEAPTIRLAELMAALSPATDLGMGQPLEFALSSCVLSVRLGEALGLDADELRDGFPKLPLI